MGSAAGSSGGTEFRSRRPIFILALFLFAFQGSAWGSAFRSQTPPAPPSEAFVFASPNTSVGLTLEQAISRLRSAEEARFGRGATALLCRVGLVGRVRPAVGSWSDGAENSMMISTTSDGETLRYISAFLGHLAHQKSVLYFRVVSGGPATLYVLRSARNHLSMVMLAKKLETAGVHFRTVIVGSRSFIIFVVDPRGELHNAVRSAARSLKAGITVKAGSAEFVGDDSGTAADHVYLPIIGQFESLHPINSNRCNTLVNR